MELPFIAILGWIMGLVTAISGGAGVFAVPAMLAFGLPPINVLALNRMSDLGVVFGALKGYIKSKSIDWRLAVLVAIPLAIGSFIGSNIVIRIPQYALSGIILAAVFVGIFFILKPIKEKSTATGSKVNSLGYVALAFVGIWNGAFAMAGATFAVLVLVHFFRKNFLQARSTDIVAAIPETIISTVILSMSAAVSWQLLLTMFVSSFAGAWVGSHLAVKHGERFIKKMMVGIAIVMIIKVLVDLIPG